MLFYTMLLLASLAAALLILWLYNLTIFAGKKMRRSKSLQKNLGQVSLASESTHGRNMQMTSQFRTRKAASGPFNINHDLAGTANHPLQSTWTGKIQKQDDYHPRSIDSNGSTLSAYLARKDREKASYKDWKQNVGRPVRDDRGGATRSSYRPRPIKATARLHIKSGQKSVNKPWGW